MPLVVFCILSCALFEIKNFHDIHEKIILDEYTSLTGEYFEEGKVNFVNGILQEMTKTIRIAT